SLMYSYASGATPGGEVVVGQSVSGGAYYAFRWSPHTGMVSLGDLPGGANLSYAYSISNDGNVIAGGAGDADGSDAVRWVGGAGPFLLAGVPSDIGTEAYAISADGSTIAGHASVQEQRQAFRWSAAGGYEPLGDLPGGAVDSSARGVSGNGS